jgi:hypothetical protein
MWGWSVSAEAEVIRAGQNSRGKTVTWRQGGLFAAVVSSGQARAAVVAASLCRCARRSRGRRHLRKVLSLSKMAGPDPKPDKTGRKVGRRMHAGAQAGAEASGRSFLQPWEGRTRGLHRPQARRDREESLDITAVPAGLLFAQDGVAIRDGLDDLPESLFDEAAFDKVVEEVFEHVYESYWGEGRRKYAQTAYRGRLRVFLRRFPPLERIFSR